MNLPRYCDIDSQGNKALVMKQYLSNEQVIQYLDKISLYPRFQEVPFGVGTHSDYSPRDPWIIKGVLPTGTVCTSYIRP